MTQRNARKWLLSARQELEAQYSDVEDLKDLVEEDSKEREEIYFYLKGRMQGLESAVAVVNHLMDLEDASCK